MVAPVVKPLSISVGSATVLVFIESVFLGSLPTLALVATFVGPFVPLVAGGWSRRKAITLEDARSVYEPLYEEIVKNESQIQSAKSYGQLPMFQREKIDQIRLSARYSLLKKRTPAVEELVESMNFIFTNQVNASASVTRIIGETIRGNPSIFKFEGDGISFRGQTTEGNSWNVPSAWFPAMLFQDLDPLDTYRRLGISITSMEIVDKSNNVKGSVPLTIEEGKYRFLWDIVKKRAVEDPLIKSMRIILGRLPGLTSEAENQALDNIKKSRSIFYS